MNMADALSLLSSWRDQAGVRDAGDELSFFNCCLANVVGSRAQLFQDVWIVYEFKGRRGGFFVEFGAADGVTLSNTHYLEKQFGWTGILAEPGRANYPSLPRNRDCFIDRRCVWMRSGEEVTFNETEVAHFSTIDSFSESDHHAPQRTGGNRYVVETVSLNDLLSQWSAPRRIDYISIDTEGSELEIIKAFDFEKYDVRAITIEHNHTANREPIQEILSKNGFVRKFEALSRWDDWYLKSYS
jgi:FkbM family methyltransferase